MTAADERGRAAAVTCPKHVVYGPCGGVTTAGGCEIDADLPCPFVAVPTVVRSGEPPARSDPHSLLHVPVCLVNHAGGAAPVAAFVAAGPAIPYVACVSVVLGPA